MQGQFVNPSPSPAVSAFTAESWTTLGSLHRARHSSEVCLLLPCSEPCTRDFNPASERSAPSCSAPDLTLQPFFRVKCLVQVDIEPGAVTQVPHLHVVGESVLALSLRSISPLVDPETPRRSQASPQLSSPSREADPPPLHGALSELLTQQV